MLSWFEKVDNNYKSLVFISFSSSQAGKKSLGRTLDWMDQYLEDAINKVTK